MAVIILCLLVVSGIMVANYQIQNQIDRNKPWNQEPGNEGPPHDDGPGGGYSTLLIRVLLEDPESQDRSLVRVEDARVIREIQDNKVFEIADNSTEETLVVVLDNRLVIEENDWIAVQGMFRKTKDKQDVWEIGIRRNTDDTVIRL